MCKRDHCATHNVYGENETIVQLTMSKPVVEGDSGEGGCHGVEMAWCGVDSGGGVTAEVVAVAWRVAAAEDGGGIDGVGGSGGSGVRWRVGESGLDDWIDQSEGNKKIHTQAENPIKEILLKLNLPDHKSILMYSQIRLLLLANTATDCGSGIGRVTKNLRIKFFNEVDILEPVSHFLEAARENLSLKICQSLKIIKLLTFTEGMMLYGSNGALGNLLMMTLCRSSRKQRVNENLDGDTMNTWTTKAPIRAIMSQLFNHTRYKKDILLELLTVNSVSFLAMTSAFIGHRSTKKLHSLYNDHYKLVIFTMNKISSALEEQTIGSWGF
nr:alpha N-terminal protein methyltransferase 1 [Tanacetum cinerariifolium]